MKRLLLGLVFGSLLTLIGLQAAHFHASPVPELCSVCTLGHQSQGEAPGAGPRTDAAIESSPLALHSSAAAVAAAFSPRQARGPPVLS